MKQIIVLTLLLICSSLGYAQRNNNNKGSAVNNSQQTQTRRPSNKKTIEPLRWDDSLKAICYDGQIYPMALVEGATFTMGEKYDNTCHHTYDIEDYGEKKFDESVLYRLTVSDYYILKSATIIQYTIKGRFMSR